MDRGHLKRGVKEKTVTNIATSLRRQSSAANNFAAYEENSLAAPSPKRGRSNAGLTSSPSQGTSRVPLAVQGSPGLNKIISLHNQSDDEPEAYSDSDVSDTDSDGGDGGTVLPLAAPPTAAFSTSGTGTMKKHVVTATYDKTRKIICRTPFPPKIDTSDCPTAVETPKEHSANSKPCRDTEAVYGNTVLSAVIGIPGVRAVVRGAEEFVRSEASQAEMRADFPFMCMRHDQHFGLGQDVVVFVRLHANLDCKNPQLEPVMEFYTGTNKVKFMGDDARVPLRAVGLQVVLQHLPVDEMKEEEAIVMNLNHLLDVSLRRECYCRF